MNWDKLSLIQFEDQIASLFNSGKIPYPVHFSDGNEDQLLEIFTRVDQNDWIFCSWRSHYHCLLKGVPRVEVENAILSGKSISLCFPEHKIFSSAIVGGHIPIALGVALDIKRKAEEHHVWCFMGDMTSETGMAQSSIRFAENFDLPITFIVEDNGVSVMTDTRLVWGLDELTVQRQKYNKVIYYRYKSRYPHAGAGKRVQF